MSRKFIDWLREVLPNDTAVIDGYPLGDLVEMYPDLYDDFKRGNDTTFAHIYFNNNLDNVDCYKEVRGIYDAQQRKIELLEAQLSKYKRPDYILVPKNSKTVVAIENMVWQQVEASGIDEPIHRLDGWRILDAIIEVAEKEYE